MLARKCFKPPTATELWQLRSACAQLGQKIAERPHGLNEQWESSTYDPATGHCYVPITQKSVAEDDKGKICNFLYDGQTNKLLAATVHAISGEKAGDVFDPQHVSPPPRSNSVEARMNDDYEDEDNYIHRLMSEDRETRQ